MPPSVSKAADLTIGAAVASSVRSGRITWTCGFCCPAWKAMMKAPAAARRRWLTFSEAVMNSDEEVCRLLRGRDCLGYIQSGDAEIETESHVCPVGVERGHGARRVAERSLPSTHEPTATGIDEGNRGRSNGERRAANSDSVPVEH